MCMYINTCTHATSNKNKKSNLGVIIIFILYTSVGSIGIHTGIPAVDNWENQKVPVIVRHNPSNENKIK